MANKAKRGRTIGRKNYTEAERNQIRLGLGESVPVASIAKMLGRGRASVYNQIERMRQRGDLGQGVLNLGQIESAANDTAQ